MSTYQYRKCVKCGARPTETLRLHRFPKPGTTSILRATAWATYCWPDKDWSSLKFLSSLYHKNKYLCGQHFEDSCYTDNMRKRLSRYAVPGKKEDVIQAMHSLRSKLSIPAIVLQVNSQRDAAIAEPVIAAEKTPPLQNAAEQATVTDRGNGSGQTTDDGLHKGEPHIDHAYVVPPKLLSEPFEVPGETQTPGVIDGVLADEVIAEFVFADDVPDCDPLPIPEVEDPAEKSLFSWQKADLIEADDPDDPERAPPAAPTLALTCDPDPGPATPDQAVPTLPALAEKDVGNRCKDCGEANEGFWFWCVECSGGALCGACAGRPPHHPHHVLRAPLTADRTQTQAVLMVIRQQLQNENLLSQHETLEDGLKLEVKEEPSEPPPPEPEPPAEPDPLACEPHAATQHQCIAEPIVDHPQPLKLPQLPEAHAHKEKLILTTQRTLVKVSPTEVKRALLSHLNRIVTTQQQGKGPQTTSQACKENLVTQPSKARDNQVPRSLLKPAGNFTDITRPNQASTQAPTSTKVNSEPQPSETVIIDLDVNETVEYLEGLDSDIETVGEVVLDDNETNEDDNRVTNEDEALDDRDDTDDDVLDEDYLVRAHAHKERLIPSTQRKPAKVSATEVKRTLLSHLDRIVTTQQQVKGPQTTSQACKENLVTQPSKAREYQVPKSLLKPAGNFTDITRPNQASTQAPTSTKVNSEPQPSETVIIDLDVNETVEYLEGLDSDIETAEEVVLDDNETNEDDNHVTNEDEALDDRDDTDDDVLDEDYLVRAHAHKERLIPSTQRKPAKVSATEVKRTLLSHLDRIVTTQQQVKGPQTTSQACKENLVTQPSKAREYQVPKSLLKPAGNFTDITRPNQASTQAPTSTKVNSEPQPSETVIIDLDVNETVEYLEGLDSDIETAEEVVLDDNETNEDDNHVTNEEDAVDDRETNEDDDGLDDDHTDDDVLDEDYLVDEDDLSEDDESDEDTIGNLDRKGVKRKIDVKQTLLIRGPVKSVIREDDLIEDDLSDEDPIVNIAGRGVKRKEDVQEPSPVRGPCSSMARALPSKAVVQVRPLSLLEIRNWTADRKRHRKH